ncbi:MAG: HTTM domain-containing protein [Cyclobacteriaceae bacterium]
MVERLIETWGNSNPHNKIFGLSRSFLAMGTLLTLTFNDIQPLFSKFNHGNIETSFGLVNVSLFSFFDNLIIPYSLSILVLVTVIIGYRPRITGILHWYISFSYMMSSAVIDGGDHLTAILTGLFIPVCVLDNRKWHWINTEHKQKKVTHNLVSNSALFMIKLQMCIMYFHAFTSKLSISEWVNGTVLYYWLEHPLFGLSNWMAPFIMPISINPFGVVLMTWGALLIEIMLFVALFASASWRPILLVTAILFHSLIIVFFGLLSFFLAVLGGLVIYLGPIKSGSFNNYFRTENYD